MKKLFPKGTAPVQWGSKQCLTIDRINTVNDSEASIGNTCLQNVKIAKRISLVIMTNNDFLLSFKSLPNFKNSSILMWRTI